LIGADKRKQNIPESHGFIREVTSAAESHSRIRAVQTKLRPQKARKTQKRNDILPLILAPFAPFAAINLKNVVETTDSTDAHGCSNKYKFVIIHPAGEGTSTNISP
jgi:hypothetical protein